MNSINYNFKELNKSENYFLSENNLNLLKIIKVFLIIFIFTFSIYSFNIIYKINNIKINKIENKIIKPKTKNINIEKKFIFDH